MPATHFLVRAVVALHLREKFDHWYATDHLPWAIRVFKCDKAWRFWSAVEEGVHCALSVMAGQPGPAFGRPGCKLVPAISLRKALRP